MFDKNEALAPQGEDNNLNIARRVKKQVGEVYNFSGPPELRPRELDPSLIEDSPIFGGHWKPTDAKTRTRTGIVGQYIVPVLRDVENYLESRRGIDYDYLGATPLEKKSFLKGIKAKELFDEVYTVFSTGDIFFKFYARNRGYSHDAPAEPIDHLDDNITRRIGLGFVQTIPKNVQGNGTNREVHVLHLFKSPTAKIPTR